SSRPAPPKRPSSSASATTAIRFTPARKNSWTPRAAWTNSSSAPPRRRPHKPRSPPRKRKRSSYVFENRPQSCFGRMRAVSFLSFSDEANRIMHFKLSDLIGGSALFIGGAILYYANYKRSDSGGRLRAKVGLAL